MDGEDWAKAALISSSDTPPVNTSPDEEVSKAAALRSVREPDRRADPSGINSSSGLIIVEESLLILTP